MRAPEKPENEFERLQTLRALGLLDTPPETRFDAITRMARLMFDVPTTVISLVDEDRQWFKSKQGTHLTETPRDISFCGHTILGSDIFVVSDAIDDDRFVDNPLVVGEPGIRFYAGCPIQAQDGCVLGTLCLIDVKPRELSAKERQILKSMASLVECELETLQTAHHDELSGLVNGRGLVLLGEHCTKLCHRSGINLTMLLFDIDNFDAFNESYGEDIGDLVLMDFAMLLRKVFRESDLLARTGDDEFVVLLANADNAKAGLALERFRLAVHDYNRRQNRTTHLKFTSVAVELDHGHHGDIEALLADAWSRMAKLS